MTRFLIHANSPHVSTGYGVQCKHLVEHLVADGHDVAISSTYGHQGAMGSWRGVPVYPTGYEVNGNDIIHNHAQHFFQGDERGGWIIPILDVWCLVNPLLKDFNVAAWTPIDHFPVPEDVLKFFHRTNAVPIAMSRFGEKLLQKQGLDPVYVPLSVDTKVYKPTPFIETADGEVSARELFHLPDKAFVVGMVAMNKGWEKDRKGFNEAFRAFGVFWSRHKDAVLYLHTEKHGAAAGLNLVELATQAGIPPHAIRWVDQYAYRLGMPAEMMAAAYTAMDVLLAPSHGEGFCVPLIEAQACGTPVIATDFSAQTELVCPATGWLLEGQPEWDAAQKASYIIPSIVDIVDNLEEAYRTDLHARLEQTIGWALHYDTETVWQNYWRPFLETLDADPEPLPLERDMIPDSDDAVAVLIPVMKRPQNVEPLVRSLVDTAPEANVYFVCDPDDQEEIDAVTAAAEGRKQVNLILSKRGHTYAVKANVGFENTSEPWVFICGDDVEFKPRWLDEARKLSDRFDVIGTNDTSGPTKNPDVAAGRHADHAFFRRSYVDTYGACLDGPGVLAPEAYQHWWVDREQIGLAQARGVFTPCLESVVEHHHPGYDGREDLRRSDPVYMLAVESAEKDAETFLNRKPLIDMQRRGRR